MSPHLDKMVRSRSRSPGPVSKSRRERGERPDRERGERRERERGAGIGLFTLKKIDLIITEILI